jgi:photosystem II stability/assembly factor-like uncharacterized protein
LKIIDSAKLTRFIIPVMLAFICIVLAGPLPAQAEWRLRDDLLSVNFANNTEGWASGRWGSIWHTSDGGKTWEQQESNTRFTLADIYFVDPNNGWAVGNQGTIVHTSDGGKTWEKQNSPVSFYHMGVFFVTPEKGWIASEETHILYTEDGGKTWTVQFKDVEFRLKSISFSDEQHGWAVGEYGYTYYTADGGKTWEHQGGFLEFDDYTGDVKGGTFLFDVIAIDPLNAWAVGIDGLVTRTSDGGKTWQEMKTGAPNTQIFFIDFDRNSTLVIGGKGFVMISTDMGTTWQSARFTPHIEYGWIYGAASAGNSGFVTVGEDGAIYQGTVQGGWNRITY